ncbi:hypothetical protein K8I61_14510 [bacterium]|nr:hypothetical protein [bacterium]
MARLRGLDHALALAFGVGVYVAHWLAEFGNHVVRRHPAAIPLIAAAIVALLMARDAAARRRPRLLRVASAFYYLPLAAYGAFLAWSLSGADAWLVPAVAAVGAVSFFLLRSGRYVIFLAVHAAALAPLVWILMRHTPEPLPIGALYIAMLLFYGLLSRREKALGAIAPVALAFYAGATLLYGTIYLRYQGIYPELAPRVIAQPGVRLIHGYDGEAFEAVGHHHMFGARAGDALLLGPHDPNESFMLLSPPWSAPGMQEIGIGTRASDMAAFDPARPDTILAASRGRVFRIGIEPFGILEETAVEAGLLNMLRVDPDRRELFASQDCGDRIVRLSLDDPADVAYSPDVGAASCTVDVVLDPVRSAFVAGVMSPFGYKLLVGDMETMRWRTSARLPFVYAFFLEIDPKARRLWVAAFFNGDLVEVDADTLEEVSRHRLGDGIRNPTFDPKRRLLYLSDYFRGDIIVWDVDRHVVRQRIFVGPIARYLQPDITGDRLVVRTSAGTFEIDLNRALRPAGSGG